MSSRTRDHLANERTFLAWIRTGASLVGLGFVVERLRFFLPGDSQKFLPSGTLVIGLAMVIVGGLLNVYAILNYLATYRSIETENYNPPRTTIILVGLITVALSVLALAILLVPLPFQGL